MECGHSEAVAECALAQVNDATESGSKVKAFYRITELPVTLVIDPVTGASPKTWTGAIDPQRYCESDRALQHPQYPLPSQPRLHSLTSYGMRGKENKCRKEHVR